MLLHCCEGLILSVLGNRTVGITVRDDYNTQGQAPKAFPILLVFLVRSPAELTSLKKKPTAYFPFITTIHIHPFSWNSLLSTPSAVLLPQTPAHLVSLAYSPLMIILNDGFWFAISVSRWDGEGGGRRGSGWGTNVHPWLNHVNVWQKLLQCCN